ncbi:MAG: TadE/TadG family type IV pilus assembly protein [Alphaproteobacteria bacterium]
MSPRFILRVLARIWRSLGGAVAVEFAICVWLLILLMVGAMEFGRAFYHHRIATNGIRDAARYLARVEDPADADSQTSAQCLALTGSLDCSKDFLLSYWTDLATVQFPPKSVDNAAGTFRGGATIPIIRATAAVAYTPPGSFLGLFGVNGITFQLAHEQRYIGD